MPGAGSAATPAETAKWRHVEKRLVAHLQGFGFVEARPALYDDDGSGSPSLRRDGVLALSRLWRRSGEGAAARWWCHSELHDPRPPTALRYYTFHGVAAVSFGAASPDADAEMLCLAGQLAADSLLAEPELLVGSVGDEDELRAYRAVIIGAVKAARRCPTCAVSDPLRVLGCDEEPCRALARTLPPMRMYLGSKARRYHEAVLARTDDVALDVVDDPTLALAGATRTVFRLTARTAGGGRHTILVGARRDRLVSAPGAPAAPLIGMCLGVERAAAAMREPAESFTSACEVFIASQGEAARRWAFRAAQQERARGFRVDMELRDVPWAVQLERARARKARVIVLAGEPEKPEGTITLCDVARSESRTVDPAQLGAELKRLLR